ncbi:MAG: AI-2E family transporter [Spirochaetia bacterium]
MEQYRFRILDGFFLLLLIIITYALYRILTPFLLDIFLAIIFTNLFWPVFIFIRKKLHGRRAISAGITIFSVFILIAVPVLIITLIVYRQALTGATVMLEKWNNLSGKLSMEDLVEKLYQIPILGDYLSKENFQLDQAVRQLLSEASAFFLDATQRSLFSITSAILHFILILFIMFYLFMDGQKITKKIMDLIPLSNRNTQELMTETVRTTNATIKSTLVIGIIEGFWGTLVFIIFGLPTPVLWGLIMTVLSVLPILGTNIVIIPTGVLMIISGRIVAGILVIILGLVGFSINQYIIRPKLMGDQSGLNPALVLLTMLGGIAWLGIIGFLVGPLLATLTIVIWEQFGKRFQEELETKNHGSE